MSLEGFICFHPQMLCNKGCKDAFFWGPVWSLDAVFYDDYFFQSDLLYFLHSDYLARIHLSKRKWNDKEQKKTEEKMVKMNRGIPCERGTHKHMKRGCGWWALPRLTDRWRYNLSQKFQKCRQNLIQQIFTWPRPECFLEES